LKKYTILFLMGKDRPGIVDDVSTFLFEKGANIEDSRMAVMGGCFSIMMLFSCSAEELENISATLSELKRWALKHPFTKRRPLKRFLMPHESYVESIGFIHGSPGNCQQVVRILRRYDVNIRSMNTGTGRAHPFRVPPFSTWFWKGLFPGGTDFLDQKRPDGTGLGNEYGFELSL
jgi:glycine cleavage system transcriptional repressor